MPQFLIHLLLEDEWVWREFFKAARRTASGLRMEYMNPFNYSYIGTRNREWRLDFLAGFLDDTAVRKQSGKDDAKYDGPCAAFAFPVISVRDFAAMKIASILDLPDAPDEFWTASQWSALRDKVRSAIQSMKLPAVDAGTR